MARLAVVSGIGERTSTSVMTELESTLEDALEANLDADTERLLPPALATEDTDDRTDDANALPTDRALDATDEALATEAWAALLTLKRVSRGPCAVLRL